MALLFRGSQRVSAAFGFTRLLLREGVTVNRAGKTRLPASSAGVRCPYSSDRRDRNQHKKMVLVGIPDPIVWFRTKIYYFIIRAYFDADFDLDEFTDGAKQAFCLVSRLLSQCQFDALDGLVAKDLVEKLEEKCRLLPSSHKQALSAEPDDIMYTTTGDMQFYEDNGRKFISILMRFWYLTSARLPDQSLEGTRVFQFPIGEDRETKRLLTANYEFQREFTQGVDPDWTITRIEHSKLLD